MKLKKASPDDFQKIYPLLYDEFGLGNMSKKRLERQTLSFKRLFDRHWNSDKDHIGYFFEDGNGVAGFMAYIFSQRLIKDRTFKFCNLSAWAVRKNSRAAGISLTMPVTDIKEEGYIITNLSPSLPAYNVFRKLHGFKELETHHIFIPYLPYFSKENKYCITFNDKINLSDLSDTEKKNFYDSAAFGAQIVQLKGDNGNCRVIYKKMYYKRHIPVSCVLSVSDPEVFSENIPILRYEINRKSFTAAILSDLRFTGDMEIKFSLKKKILNPKLYWSENKDLTVIDNLYSENLF